MGTESTLTPPTPAGEVQPGLLVKALQVAVLIGTYLLALAVILGMGLMLANYLQGFFGAGEGTDLLNQATLAVRNASLS